MCLVTIQKGFPTVNCDQQHLEAKDLNISKLPSPPQSEAVFFICSSLIIKISPAALSNLQSIEHLRHRQEIIPNLTTWRCKPLGQCHEFPSRLFSILTFIHSLAHIVGSNFRFPFFKIKYKSFPSSSRTLELFSSKK